MTIRAILHDGIIQPIEPLPAVWTEGQELTVEEPKSARTPADIGQWTQELDAATAQVPPDEHDRFREALKQIEQESKQAVRQQWGLP